MNTAVEPSAPEHFGPYLVYDRLGLGGMATVYRAKKHGIAGFERAVALKRMLAHLAEDSVFVDSFIREAKVASLLMHPNIAQIYDFGRIAGVYFIAMELVAGFDLGKVLRHANRSNEAIPLSVVLSILIELCDALEYAHTFVDDNGASLGIVHRDVSPSNLIVGMSGHLKVIDFGIAKASSRQLHTQSGKVKGKLGYMSPEAAMGMPIGPNSDVFSVGVVGWELITASPLFSAKTDFETMRRIREGDIVPPSHGNPACPPELDEIILAALDREPSSRLQSAGEFRRGLEDVANHYGIRVSARDVSEWMQRLVQPEDAWARGPSSPNLAAAGAPSRPSMRASQALGDASIAARGSKPRLLKTPDDVQAATEIWGGPDLQSSLLAGGASAEFRPSAAELRASGVQLSSMGGPGVDGMAFSAQPPAAADNRNKIIAAVALLAAVGGAGIYVMSSRKKPAAQTQTATTQPAVVSQQRAAGQLQFVIQPEGAIIEIGGKEVSRTSPFTMDIEPGMYSIVVRKDGFKRWGNSISLKSGEQQTINVALEAGIAHVALDSKPQGLVVVLDGTPTEYKTPARFETTAGPHQLKVSNTDGDVWSQEFTATVDGTYTFTAKIVAAAKPAPEPPPPPPVRTRGRGKQNASAKSVAETKAATKSAGETKAAKSGSTKSPAIVAKVETPAAPAVTAPSIAKPVPAAVTAPAVATPAKPARTPIVAMTAVAKLSGDMPRLKSSDGAVSGDVLAKMCIDEQGHVTSVKVVKAPGAMSSDLSSALSSWRYRPYVKDGQTLAVCFPLTLRVVGQ